jgi:predicted RNA binding protein YcfA (HicA-like mRNA interferase family)
MPKLRRLSGREVLAILQQLGFSIVRSRGSHFTLKMGACTITIPVHGSDPLATGTLRQIYKDALVCVPEDQLRLSFYTN